MNTTQKTAAYVALAVCAAPLVTCAAGCTQSSNHASSSGGITVADGAGTKSSSLGN